MDYLDFELEIAVEQDGEYPVRVLSSPGGEASGVFQMPFVGLELERHLKELENALLRSGGPRRQALSAEQRTVQDFGRQLFDRLFSGEIRTRYAVSLTRANTQSKGLRLKLRIQDPRLAALPWEFLYDADRGDYVCLLDETPIVRYLDLPRPLQPLAVELPLRILGMIASPKDLEPLNVDRERSRVENALRYAQQAGLVELAWLEGQTWRDLQRAMRRGPWHIFHFIGHGRFDAYSDEGQIALARRDGYAHLLSATGMGRLLSGHRSLGLVLLNACLGAHSEGNDIFSSTASILVRHGIPAVVAMQHEITDDAAIEFARVFYEIIAEGEPIDAALTNARKAISVAINNSVEWGTPVLFMRSPDGNLFDVAGAPEPVEPQPERDAGLEDRLRDLYLQANSAYWSENYDRAVGLFREIEILQRNYRDAAAKLAESEGKLRAAWLYEDARQAVDQEEWPRAQRALQELLELDPGDENAALLLKEVQHQLQLSDLVAQAGDLFEHRHWQAVVNIFRQIEALAPDYGDPDGLLSIASQALESQEEQRRISELYAAGLEAMDAHNWGDAIECFSEIEKAQAEYEDTPHLLKRARSELAREHQVEPGAPTPEQEERFVDSSPSPVRDRRSRKVRVEGQERLLITRPIEMEFLRVPAGEFLMGSDPNVDKNAREDEQPHRRVRLTEYFIGRTPVTNSQYSVFVSAKNKKPPSGWKQGKIPEGEEDHPVVYVGWQDAITFCEWLSEQSGHPIRLPTEAEWEKAARGTNGQIYPWGNDEPTKERANFGLNRGTTTEVGNYSPKGDSPYRCTDMAGNVWEWVADWYAPDHYWTLENGVNNPAGPKWGAGRVLRGGSWVSNADLLRAAHRFKDVPVGSVFDGGGFRCVLEA